LSQLKKIIFQPLKLNGRSTWTGDDHIMKASRKKTTVGTNHLAEPTAYSVTNHGLADLFRDRETKTLTSISITSHKQEELVTIKATTSSLNS